jgi:hypothetical protein
VSAAGYDVVVSDVVTGRRERGDRVQEVVIDPGGRLRLTLTRAKDPPQGERLTSGRRQFRVLRERREITTVMCELNRPEDLAEALPAAEALATGSQYS